MANAYITIKEASKMMGVSPLTLRNWYKNGNLKAYSHPINNYRVYTKEKIEAVLQQIETGVKNEDKREFKKIIIKHLTD